MAQSAQQKKPRAIAVLSAAGFIICFYLTAVYYTTDGTGAYCGGVWQCGEVLNSRFSKIFGIPASLVGGVGYAVMAFLNFRNPAAYRSATLAMASAGTGISVYLSWAEFFVIKQICPFCVASALIVASIWVLSSRKTTGSQMAAAVLIAVFSGTAGYASSVIWQSRGTVAVKTASADFQKNLALHLTRSGAVMYGSFKCPACTAQKGYFGKYAKKLNYIECHPEGKNANPLLCMQKGIKAFPTWEIGGSMRKGAMSLEKLSEFSGYEKTAQ